jgi:hypothetical protein
MKKLMLLIVTLVAALMSGCSSTKYTDRIPDTAVPIEDAVNIISRLTMTQHPKWRPDGIGITEEFIYWGYGTTTRGSLGAVAIGSFGIANSRSVTRDAGDRVYFADIQEVKFLDWKRKGKQWYVVSLLDRNIGRKHIFRTRNHEDAISYFDSFASILKSYQDGELKKLIDN